MQLFLSRLNFSALIQPYFAKFFAAKKLTAQNSRDWTLDYQSRPLNLVWKVQIPSDRTHV